MGRTANGAFAAPLGCAKSRHQAGRRRWPSWSDLGERWPSRLVATAAENRLNFRRNPHTLVCGSQRLPNNRDFRSCPNTRNANRHSNVRVGTTQRSIAATAAAWLRRNVRQVCDGGPRRRIMYLETVDSAISNPSLSSSPWMRGAPNRFPGGSWEDRGYSWFAGRTLLSGHCFRRSCRRRGRPPLRPDMIFGRDTVKWGKHQ